jgi:hypothetical protein
MTSKIIIIFLTSHPIVSLNALELKLNIPKGTLRHAIKGRREIPEKFIEPLMKELEGYGLVGNSEQLKKD